MTPTPTGISSATEPRDAAVTSMTTNAVREDAATPREASVFDENNAPPSSGHDGGEGSVPAGFADKCQSTAANTRLDREEARRHLSALGIEAAHFQTFDDNAQRKDPRLARVLYGRFEDYADDLEALNRQGAGVFVTIDETRPGTTRRKEDVIAVRALFVDLDGAPIKPVLQWKLKPHLVVESSPDKFHAYWRTDGSVPLDLFTELQRRLITLFNGDKSVNDLPRVLRLAGFWHQKVKRDGTCSEPFKTRIFREGCE
jgi:hypothetical protein